MKVSQELDIINTIIMLFILFNNINLFQMNLKTTFS